MATLYVLSRGTVNSVGGPSQAWGLSSFPTHFGTVPAQGPWTNNPRPSPMHGRQQHLNRITIGAPPLLADRRTPPSNANEELCEDPSRLMNLDSGEERAEQNRKRAASREFQRPYLKEMAQAHAQNREPIIQIPVCKSGTVLGLKSPWHRAARLCARQTLNFKVRSYKAKHEYWMSQVECIAEKLAQKFTYTNPVDIKYISKFLKHSLKNDRKKWKAHFIETGSKHERCPDEAFTEWRKYWVSAVGRDESLQMTEMRKGKQKSARVEHCPRLQKIPGSE